MAMKASNQNCALPVFPLGTSNVSVSLPHVRNGRFLAGTFMHLMSLVGRLEPVADATPSTDSSRPGADTYDRPL